MRGGVTMEILMTIGLILLGIVAVSLVTGVVVLVLFYLVAVKTHMDIHS